MGGLTLGGDGGAGGNFGQVISSGSSVTRSFGMPGGDGVAGGTIASVVVAVAVAAPAAVGFC